MHILRVILACFSWGRCLLASSDVVFGAREMLSCDLTARVVWKHTKAGQIRKQLVGRLFFGEQAQWGWQEIGDYLVCTGCKCLSLPHFTTFPAHFLCVLHAYWGRGWLNRACQYFSFCFQLFCLKILSFSHELFARLWRSSKKHAK